MVLAGIPIASSLAAEATLRRWSERAHLLFAYLGYFLSLYRDNNSTVGLYRASGSYTLASPDGTNLAIEDASH